MRTHGLDANANITPEGSKAINGLGLTDLSQFRRARQEGVDTSQHRTVPSNDPVNMVSLLGFISNEHSLESKYELEQIFFKNTVFWLSRQNMLVKKEMSSHRKRTILHDLQSIGCVGCHTTTNIEVSHYFHCTGLYRGGVTI